MENPNNEPRENSEYGWKKSDPPTPIRQNSGKRGLFVVMGVFLIIAGAFGLVGVMFMPVIPNSDSSISWTVVEAVPVTESIRESIQQSVTWSVTPFDRQRFQNTDGANVLESQINLADFGIDTISISAAVADVFIWGHDSDELDISIEMHGDVTYDVTFSGNLVTISNDDRFSINLGRRISDQLFIKVPHSYKGDLTIQLAAGTADVSGVEGNRLNIEMTAGEFTLNDVNYNKFRLDLAAGSFDGYNISADIDINMTAGEVNLSGDLGNTTYKAAAGSVSLDYNKMPSSINVDAAVGSVDIFLPANSRFRLRNESIMGSTSNDFESFPDTANVISINMAMGQTNIHKK